MRAQEERRYESLSPFELKNKLISMSQTHHERMMLNAGRGNPNWVAVTPRHAFFQLGLFALEESEKVMVRTGFGGAPTGKGSAKRFEEFLTKNSSVPGVEFLKDAFTYVVNELKINADVFITEMVDAILGDHYPMPDRMLNCSETIVHKYLAEEMCAGQPPKGKGPPKGGGQIARRHLIGQLLGEGIRVDPSPVGTFRSHVEEEKSSDQ